MSTPRPANIAIVGMSCLFPGAGSLHRFWENVVGRVDAVSDPPEEWPFHYGFDPESNANDRLYCKRGGYLNDLAEFDPVAYGVMPTAVDGADPEQFLALRVAHETMADGGYMERPFNRKATAVILGRGAFPNRGLVTALQHGMVVDQTLDILKRLHPEYGDDVLAEIKQELKAGIPQFNADTTPGLISNVMTGRIANRLDLQGPNYGVDAACAASLLAVDHGIRELESGRCDMVLAGGVSVFSSAALNLAFCQLNAASRQGMIRPFDERADGTLLGSGLGMVLLKRLEDAERDGDRIYSVIRGIGIASDGRATGILAPRIDGEELAIRRAYESTGYDPATIDLVEAHGTGTPVGDAAEIQSLTRVFGLRQGEHPKVALGSVKSMISHLIPAAGIAGLIKMSLSLYHKVLPPTINCERPNPELGLDKTPFYLNTQTRPWIHAADHPRRAGMNSFGFGGINTHTILEEYVGPAADESHTLMREWDSEVLLLQGGSRDEVLERCQSVLQHLQREEEPSLKDLAFTLNGPYQPERQTLAIVAESAEDLTRKLEYAAGQLQNSDVTRLQDRNGVYYFADRDPNAKLAFLFPGEGCQYPNLLADLCLHFPEVRRAFDLSDGIWREAFSDFLTSEVLFPIPSPDPNDPPVVDERIWELDVATSAVYTANYAMFRLLQQLKIQPDFMAGHSSGELTALHASGALLDQEDEQIMSLCLDLLATGRSMIDQVPGATLMTVGVTDREIVDEFLERSGNEIEVVIDNCPHQVILCGSEAAITSAREQLQSEGAICTLLPFHRAYHTSKYQPVSDAFFDLFGHRDFAAPGVPVYSCATAERYPDDPMQVRRWAADQWAQPVRFQQTVHALYDAGTRLFVEVGPRATLTGFVEDILEDEPFVAIPSNVQFRSGIMQLNHLLGVLAASGIAMDLNELYRRRDPQQVPIDSASAPETIARRMPPMVLNLELPLLELKTPEKHRPAPQTARVEDPVGDIVEPASKFRPQSTRPQPTAADREPHKESSRRDASAGSAPAAAAVSTVRGVSADHKSQVMQNYLASMDQFLQMQQQVYSAFLERRPSAPGTSHHNGTSTGTPHHS